jgi:DNA-binding protein H-NS
MTNSTLAQLKSQYEQLQTTYKRESAALEKQIAEAKKIEQANALAQIRSIMDEFGITPTDLGAGKKLSKAKKSSTVPAKYRGPNGETWTGRGRQPKWVGDNREKYLIKN